MRTFMHSRRQAFTLIELLIVISIIALLAAILFPVFARARESARRVSCQSNMKQIGLGLMQYTQDYDERFPMLFEGADVVDGMENTWGTPVLAPAGSVGSVQTSWIGTWDHFSTWQDLIQPHIKSSQIFNCPSMPSNQQWDVQYYFNPVVSGFMRSNTGYCSFPLPAVPLSQAQLSRSAQTFLVIEAATNNACGNQTLFCAYPYAIEQYGAASPTKRPLVFRHFDGMNILHGDGHVKWYPADRFRNGDLASYVVSSLFPDNPYFCP